MINKIFIRGIAGFLSLIVIIAFSIMTFMTFSPQFGGEPTGARLEKMNQSEHFENGRFENLITTEMDMSLSKMPGLMYEFMFNGNGRTPAKPLPVLFDGSGLEYPDSAAKITWYGHSALLLEIDNKKILLDPMLGKAASPVSFMTNRFAYEQPIDLEAIPKIDAIIYSHDHYDHLDYSSVTALKEKTEHFYTPLGVGAHLESWGVPADKISELDWWESADVGNTKLIAAPARHFSGRGLTDRNKTQWASWIIVGENEKIYFSGDSGYGPHFKEIGERFGPFDFAMMECGQYNERWEAIHMMPEQTIQAALDIKSKKMMPIHWSAFSLSLHNWTEPVERALQAAQELDVNMITPQIGLRFCPKTSNEHIAWWRDF